MNTTFSNQVDNPSCPKNKYPFNTRCRFWYLASKQRPGMVVYPPLQILSFNGEQQLINLICQRTLTRSKQLYSVFCDYMFVEDLKKFFKGYQNIKTHQIIFDPYSFVAIYDSRQDLDMSKTIKLQDILRDSVGKSESLNQLYLMIKQKYSNRLIKTEKYLDFTDIITSNKFQLQYNFQDESENNYIAILNLLFTVEKLDSDVDYDASSYSSTYPNKFNYINIYILIDIISEKELMSFSNKILDQQKIVFILTNVSLGVLLIVVIYIIFKYSIIFSHMIQYPVNHLIKIFSNIQLNLDDINEYIIAQNTQYLDQQTELYNIFSSEDTKILYESFTSLVKMLRYSALNLLKEDPSENLLNLNLQISFFEKFQNKQSLGICHNNLANIHFLQGRYLEALDHYERSIIYAQDELNLYRENSDNLAKMQQRISKFLSTQRQTTQTKASIYQTKKKVDISNNVLTTQDQVFRKKETSEIIQTRNEKLELIQNLFNRKYNYFKCLNAYYEQEIKEQIKQNQSFNQKNQNIQDIFYVEELITVANDLLKISQKMQDGNLGREIILRIYILEYLISLDDQKSAEIQYEIVKSLYDIKLQEEQDNLFTLDQSMKAHSFLQLRKRNKSTASSRSTKNEQNKPNNQNTLKKEAKHSSIINRQNNLIKETAGILFNQTIDTNKQSIFFDKKMKARKNSFITKQRDLYVENQIEEKETIQDSSVFLQKKMNPKKTIFDQINNDLNYLKVDQEQKIQIDEIGLDLKTRNSIQSNQYLVSQISAKEQKDIGTLFSPIDVNEKLLKDQLSTNRKASQEFLGQLQIQNNKTEQSQLITPRITQVLIQNEDENNEKKETYSNYNSNREEEDFNFEKQEQLFVSNVKRNTQFTTKRISYAIDSSPNTRPIRVKTTQQYNSSPFQKSVNKRLSQQAELKNLAYDQNCDILQSFVAISKAKLLLKQNKIYEALSILTQSLEDQKYYSYKGKYKVLQLIQSIFAEKNLYSKQLYNIIDKFQQKRVFKLAVVVCCSKQKNRESSHWIINEIIQNILMFKEDGLGVIKYRFGEQHFQQLFKLLCKTQISQNSGIIANQLLDIKNKEYVDQHQKNNFANTCNCFSCLFSQNEICDSDCENLKYFNQNVNNSKIQEKIENNTLLISTKPMKKQKQSKNQILSNLQNQNIQNIYQQNSHQLLKQIQFNQLFHLCVKNAVNNIFFDKNLQLIEQNKLSQGQQNNDKSHHKFEKNQNNLELPQEFSIHKCIILIIDKPYIDFDEQFQSLNCFLKQMQIRLLILQLNDIECQQEYTTLDNLKHAQRFLIKQFYSAEKLLRYLYEQRINNKQLQVDYNIEFY